MDSPINTASSGAAEARAQQRTALVLIDLQNSYFELPGLAPHRDWIVERANDLLRAAHRGGQPVIAVRTEHARNRSTWTLNMLEDDQGFAFPGTEQAILLADLELGEDVIDVAKTRDDAFFQTSLAEHLAELGVDGILLCGVSTHSCVAQTAIGAFARNIPCAVAHGAVASEDAELSEALMKFLHRELRQSVLDREAAVAALQGTSSDVP